MSEPMVETKLKTSAADEAYERLERMIVQAELPPGAVMTEHSLVQRLGLGRTPMREALQRLAQERMVVILPRRGIQIPEIGITELQSVFEVRIHLERLCGRLATQRITPEEIAQLEGLFDGMVAVGYSDHHLEVDRKFHRVLLRSTRNPSLEDMLSRTHAFSLRLLHMARGHMNTTRDGYQDYLEIIQALKERDSATAEEGLVRHAKSLYEAIRQSL